MQYPRSSFQETQQKNCENLLGVLRGKLTLGPPATNSRRFRPAVGTLVNTFILCYLNILSNIGTEITIHTALRCGTTSTRFKGSLAGKCKKESGSKRCVSFAYIWCLVN